MTPHFPRRALLGLASALTLAATFTTGAWAQAFPSKPISLVVPFPPGGTTDVLARALGERLSTALATPVIVENKPGAGATIGADHVAKAKADGHVLLIGAVHHTIATSVYPKLPYDFQKDLAPVTTIALVPNVLVVNAATPVKNVAELQSFLKAKPDKAVFGSNGNGTAQHLIGTQFENLTAINLTHIPYKGSGPMATDLLGGQITMSFDTITPVLPHIKAGKLRPLAVTIDVYMAGGGCTLPGKATVLMPGQGYEGVAEFVFDVITSRGVNACPPLLVGVGVSTSAETAARLSKKAILRPVTARNANEKAALMEDLLTDGLNELGLGPQGLTGNHSVMGVNIESSARHPSTIGVAVSTGCWAHRRGRIKINADLTHEVISHEGFQS